MVTRSRAGERVGQETVVEAAVLRHHQLHAPLVRLRRLAEQQGGQHRFADRRDHLVGERLGQFQFGGREVHGLLRPAQFDQGDDGVEPVRRLVRLRAQRLGETALGVQLAHQRLEFRHIAQGDDRAPALAARHRGGVDDQHPVGGQMHLVDARLGRQQRARQRRRQPQLGHGPADDRASPSVVRDAQQLPPAVVHQRHPVLPVEHQQPLAYGVQGGLVVVVHTAQLGRVHPVRVPAQARVDDVRARPRPAPARAAATPNSAVTWSWTRALISSTRIPALTSPMIAPSAPSARIGVTARTDGPSVPEKVSVNDSPRSARSRVPEEALPDLRPCRGGSSGCPRGS